MKEEASDKVGELRHYVREFSPFFTGKTPQFLWLFALGVVGAAADGLGTNLLILFVYTIMGETSGQQDILDGLGPVMVRVMGFIGQNPVQIGLIVLALIVGASILSALYTLAATRLSNDLAQRTRTAIFNQYLSLDYGYIKRLGQGYLLDLLEYEGTFVSQAAMLIMGLLHNIILVSIYGVLILLLSWKAALGLVIAALLYIPTLLLPAGWIGRLSARVSAANAASVGCGAEGIRAMRSIRMFGAERQIYRRFEILSEGLKRATIDLGAFSALLEPVRRVSTIGIAIAFFFAAVTIGINAATVATIVALVYRIYPSVMGIEGTTTELLRLRAPIRLVSELLTPVGKTYPSAGTVPFDGVFSKIVFSEVSYSYPGAKTPAVDRASFTILRGDTVVITGISGSGKTTIVNLIARLFEPTEGSILVDGVSLDSLERQSWFKHVSFAGQDLELINGTVLENITLYRDIDRESVDDAVRISGANEFVSTLPKGLDTRIGDAGDSLSGGQRQRIVLARALAGNPSILVLDEGTNAIDIDAENAMFQALRRARPGLTVIIITHRPSLVDATLQLVLQRSHLNVKEKRHVEPEV